MRCEKLAKIDSLRVASKRLHDSMEFKQMVLPHDSNP